VARGGSSRRREKGMSRAPGRVGAPSELGLHVSFRPGGWRNGVSASPLGNLTSRYRRQYRLSCRSPATRRCCADPGPRAIPNVRCIGGGVRTGETYMLSAARLGVERDSRDFTGVTGCHGHAREITGLIP
jgi:hypothetical protein